MVQLPYNKQGLGLYVYYAKLKKIRRKINLDFFFKKILPDLRENIIDMKIVFQIFWGLSGMKI